MLVSPRRASAARASSTSRFTTSGTVAVVRLTVRRMEVPCSRCAPFAGTCDRMIPPGRGLSTNTALMSKPDFSMAAAALNTSRSTTSGTATMGACSVILEYATTPATASTNGAARMTAQCRAFHVRAAAGGRAAPRRRLGLGGFSGFTGFGALATFGYLVRARHQLRFGVVTADDAAGTDPGGGAGAPAARAG